MKKTKKLKNQGFSLIELIVVIAIIAILTSIFTMGVSVLTNKAVQQCAKKIQVGLESIRTKTMGKESASISFYIDNKGNVYLQETINGVPNSAVQIGTAETKVSYVKGTEPTATPTYLTTTALVIQFDRSSGSMKPQGDGKYVSKFIVENSNGNKVLHVKIDKLTGKVSVE